MRLRVEVVTRASEIPWSQVLAPGRGIAYQLLAVAEPTMGQMLHEYGIGPHRMVPIGHSAPLFPGARRQPGRYAAGGRGVIEFGSPIPEIVDAWARAIRQREMLDWGGVAMRIVDVATVQPPDFPGDKARMRTATPVVMKRGGAGADTLTADSPEAGTQSDRAGQARNRPVWLLPGEPEFPSCFQGNLHRKLETLGISGKLLLDGITWVGSKRSFGVGGGAKPGAPVEVDLSGETEALQAIWSWGLGQANSAGFGWVAA